MRILDLRPAVVRAWTRRWDGRVPDAAGGTPGAPARLAARVADALMRRRVAARPLPPADLCVVSVGNLAFGGTGKTPVVAALAQALSAQGRKGAVLTRGYGSRRPGPLVVAANDREAGDEARLLAAAVDPAGWLVVQAQDRARGLALLQERLGGGAVVLLEDGHQTAGVGRHLDVLILDRWRRDEKAGSRVLRPETGPVAPFGPWRESAAGAERADVWLVEADDPPARGHDGRRVAGFRRGLRLTTPDGRDLPAQAAWAGLSGIARPWMFEAQVAAIRGAPAALAVRCADHEPYADRLWRRVEAAIRGHDGLLTVTTEKDWVKIAARWPQDLPVAIARQRLQWTGTPTLPDIVGERCGACRESLPLRRGGLVENDR